MPEIVSESLQGRLFQRREPPRMFTPRAFALATPLHASCWAGILEPESADTQPDDTADARLLWNPGRFYGGSPETFCVLCSRFRWT